LVSVQGPFYSEIYALDHSTIQDMSDTFGNVAFTVGPQTYEFVSGSPPSESFFTATEPFPWAQFAETIESPND
jgi:hypothetical protein